MAKTTKQTEADLQQLNAVLGQLADKAKSVESAINTSTSFNAYDKLSEKLLGLIGTYSQLAIVQEKVKSGATLHEVGSVQPLREDVNYASSSKFNVPFGTIDERRINLAALGVPFTNEELKSKAKTAIDQVRRFIDNENKETNVTSKLSNPSQLAAEGRLTAKRALDSLEAERTKNPTIFSNAPTNKEADLKRILDLMGQLDIKIKLTGEDLIRLEGGKGTDKLAKELNDLILLFARLNTQADRLKASLQEVDKPTQNNATTSGFTNADTRMPVEIDESALEKAKGGYQSFGKSAQEAGKNIKEVTEDQIKAREANIQYANALKFAEDVERKTGAKFDPKQTTISEGGLGGRAVFDFKGIDESTGAIRRLQVATDEAGNVFPSVQRKFRDFSQSVVRDIGELAKWTLAISLIYGPLQKLQEITTLMIENEVKLAEATVTINSANAEASQIFDTVAESANRAGESINDTIQAFTYSYRAIGNSVNQTERYSAATKLLDDSLILSKLSSLDATQAIDTLSAAVRQTGGDFNATSHLLDSWVKVTKIANVDMATLATGVATLGDAAETAGIDTDHLNGIIAVLAQNSNLSGQEVANAGRALVTGLYTDKSVKALQEVGIATKDANGNLRDFLSIVQQIREYDEAGLISAAQYKNITDSAGGGSRRGATFSSFIRQSGDIGSIAAESAKANGEAQDALAKQTATAQTAIVKLDNSFQSLAETLGTEGGFLQIFKDITNTTSTLVDGLDSLVSMTGKATPALLALGAAAAYLFSRTDPKSTQNLILGRVQNSITGGINSVFGGRGVYGNNYGGGLIGPAELGQGTLGERASGFLTGSGTGSRIFQGALAGAIPALYNATSGEKFGTEKAAADIVGGIVGTLAAGPAGGIIGTAIAEGFIRATTTDTKLQDYFKNITVTSLEDLPEQTKSEAESNLYKNQQLPFGISVGNELIGNQVATISTAYINSITENINKIFAKGENANLADRYQLQLYKAAGFLTDKSAQEGLTNRSQISDITVGQAALANAGPEAAAIYKKILDAIAKAGGVEGQVSAFQQKINAAGQQQIGGVTTNAYLDSIVKSRIEDLNTKRFAGDINTTDYTEKSSSVLGAKSTAEGFFAGFGKEFMDSAKVKDTAEAYRGLLDILTYGSADSTQNLNELLATITDIENAIAGGTATPEQISNLPLFKKLAGNTAADALSQARINQISPPNIVGDINNPNTSAQSELIMQRTKELEKGFYGSKEGGGLSESDMNAYLKKNFEEAAEPIKDSTELFYKMLEAFDPKFRSIAEEQLKKEGKLPDESKEIGFQDYKNVDRATLEKAARQSISMGQEWQTKFNYDFKPEDQVAIAKDGIAKPLHADFKIMQLLLEKLVDQGQKQLDGMYNIPEGATFWVPLTAAYYGRGGSGGSSTTEEDYTTRDITTGSGYNPKNIQNTAPTGLLGSYDPNLETGQSNAQNWLNKQLEALKKMAAGPEMSTGQTNARDWLEKYSGRESAQKTPGGLDSSTKVPETRLNLNIQTNTSVLLDGRLIASIIKTYLAEDLVRTSAGTGSTTKDYIV